MSEGLYTTRNKKRNAHFHDRRDAMHKPTRVAVTVVCTLFVFLIFPATILRAETTEETLRKDFPDFIFDSVQSTPVKGIFAVIYAGQEVVYYLPENGILITGEMIAGGGINMTEEVKGELLSRHYGEIPLDMAIRAGKGKHMVVEITDPDCPYCRTGAKYFSDRNDVTRYILFWPLSAESEQKVRHILCAEDRLNMYEKVMAGKYDEEAIPGTCQDPEVEALIKSWKELGVKIGMTGTPVYFINGKAVRGANIPLIEVFLADDEAKDQTMLKTSEPPSPETGILEGARPAGKP